MTKSIIRIFLAALAMMLPSALHAEEAKDLFITGDATEYGWVYSNPEASRLVQQPDGTYRWSGNLAKNKNFRFLVQKKWYPTYTTVESAGKKFEPGTYKIQYDAEKRAGEPAFGIATGGEYTVTVDLEAMEMTLRLDKADENTDDTHIYITGSATPAGWSTGNAIEMTKTTPGKFTWTGDLTGNDDGRFRFLTSRNWYPTYTTAESSHQSVTAGKYPLQYDEVSRKGEPSFKIEIAGNYTVNVDINAMEMELILNSAVEVKKMFIIGNALTGLDGNNGNIEMKLTGNNLYEWTGELFPLTESGARAGFRFSPDPGQPLTYTCRTDIPGDEAINPGDTYDLFEKTEDDGLCDNMFYTGEQGRYTISVDTRLMTMTVSLIKPELYIVGAAITGGNTPWALNDNYLAKMTETDPLVFEWTGYLYAKAKNGDPGRFKFLTSNNSWAGYVSAASQHLTVELGTEYPLLDSTQPGSGDNQFIMPEGGRYHVMVDTRRRILKITGENTDAATVPVSDACTIKVTGRTLCITSPETADIIVCDVAGRPVTANRCNYTEVQIPAAGLYIVRVNGTTSKIVVK